jgi:hypothetical protein
VGGPILPKVFCQNGKFGNIGPELLGPLYKFSNYIENPAYASNFMTTSQEEKVTNEITGFSTVVGCDWTQDFRNGAA